MEIRASESLGLFCVSEEVEDAESSLFDESFTGLVRELFSFGFSVGFLSGVWVDRVVGDGSGELAGRVPEMGPSAKTTAEDENKRTEDKNRTADNRRILPNFFKGIKINAPLS